MRLNSTTINGKYETVYTNSLIKFIKLRLTKILIYYKVNFEDKYKDFFL